ncbi:MAG: KEOPS complex kinase/ATPase Bud32 [Nitrososphaerales archaeon]
MSKQAHFAPKLGAEAKIELIDWHGRQAISKKRLRKEYRNEDLDYFLLAKRTREETHILHMAKLSGVDCPEVYFADPSEFEIVMEYVPGSLLKDLEANSLLEMKKLDSAYMTLGTYAERLHSAKIIHGDLTTKNVILSGDRVRLIDFGLSFLSERKEDMAEDLHLLKQALRSTLGPERSKKVFDLVLAGYSTSCSKHTFKSLLKQVASIEARGRYARVD